MAIARYGDLVRRTIHQLTARQFFHQIGVRMGIFHQLDPMRQPVMLVATWASFSCWMPSFAWVSSRLTARVRPKSHSCRNTPPPLMEMAGRIKARKKRVTERLIRIHPTDHTLIRGVKRDLSLNS